MRLCLHWMTVGFLMVAVIYGKALVRLGIYLARSFALNYDTAFISHSNLNSSFYHYVLVSHGKLSQTSKQYFSLLPSSNQKCLARGLCRRVLRNEDYSVSLEKWYWKHKEDTITLDALLKMVFIPRTVKINSPL